MAPRIITTLPETFIGMQCRVPSLCVIVTPLSGSYLKCNDTPVIGTAGPFYLETLPVIIKKSGLCVSSRLGAAFVVSTIRRLSAGPMGSRNGGLLE